MNKKKLKEKNKESIRDNNIVIQFNSFFIF